MSDSQEIQRAGDTSLNEYFDREEITVLRNVIAPDANKHQLMLFGKVCQRTGLDPFSGQIHAVVRGGKLTIQTGIDGLRLIAQRSGEYKGQTEPVWYDREGEAYDIWLKDEYPAAAKVGVYRAGFPDPLYGIAMWDSYYPGDGGQGHMWRSMPEHMLAKCAEALALRKAFPNETSGIYTNAEMEQAGPIEATEFGAEEVTDEDRKTRSETLADTLEANARPADPQPSEPEAVEAEEIEAEVVEETENVDEVTEAVSIAEQKFAPKLKRAGSEEQLDTLYADALGFFESFGEEAEEKAADVLDRACAVWEENQAAGE